MESFMRHCPETPETRRARELVAARAFQAWRALPRDVHAAFQRRLLAVWTNQPTAGCIGLGGPVFRFLARLGGPINAARLLRLLRGHSYDSCRTIEDSRVLEEWIAQLPAA